MPQLTKNARRVLDQLDATLVDIADEARLGYDKARFNPDYTRDRLTAIQNDVAEIRKMIRQQIEPLLERQAPQYDKRLAELEARLARLEESEPPALHMVKRKAE